MAPYLWNTLKEDGLLEIINPAFCLVADAVIVTPHMPDVKSRLRFNVHRELGACDTFLESLGRCCSSDALICEQQLGTEQQNLRAMTIAMSLGC
jgi:hypothetical protein